MATPRAEQLQKLAGALPGANQRVSQGLQEARKTQLQEAVRQARPGTGTRTAQQLGAQQAQQAGQINLAAQRQGQQQAGQLGNVMLQGQAREQRERGFQQQLALTQAQQDQANKLGQLDRDLKNQLLDSQLQFQTDQAGQQLLNTRQALDWAVLNAQNEEQYRNYAQQAQQVYQRKIRMLEQANRQITDVLQRGYVKEGQQLNQEQQKRLIEQKRAVEAELQRKQNEAANNAAMWQAGGTILGTAAGAILGGPAGAALGASVGGGLGTAIGGATA